MDLNLQLMGGEPANFWQLIQQRDGLALGHLMLECQ